MADIVAKMSEPEIPHCSFDNGKTWVPDGVVIAEYFTDAAAEITRLRATVKNIALKLGETLDALFMKVSTVEERDAEILRLRATVEELTRALGEADACLSMHAFSPDHPTRTAIRAALAKGGDHDR